MHKLHHNNRHYEQCKHSFCREAGYIQYIISQIYRRYRYNITRYRHNTYDRCILLLIHPRQLGS